MIPAVLHTDRSCEWVWRGGRTTQEMTHLDHFCSGLGATLLVYLDKHLSNIFSRYKVESIYQSCIMNPEIKCYRPSS